MTSEESLSPIEEAIKLSEEQLKEIKQMKRDLQELRNSDDDNEGPGLGGNGAAVAET